MQALIFRVRLITNPFKIILTTGKELRPNTPDCWTYWELWWSSGF